MLLDGGCRGQGGWRGISRRIGGGLCFTIVVKVVNVVLCMFSCPRRRILTGAFVVVCLATSGIGASVGRA